MGLLDIFSGIGSGILENLIGTVPSTRSAGAFASDILNSFDNPRGLVGQLGRAAMTIGALEQSGIAGLAQIQDTFRRTDDRRRAEYEYAALNRLTPDEFYTTFSHPLPSTIKTKAADMPAFGEEAMTMGVPSRPEQVVDFPIPPEESMKRDLMELRQARADPRFVGGARTGAQAQRAGLPADFGENTQMSKNQLGDVDPGRAKVVESISPEGTSFSVAPKDPEDYFLTKEQWEMQPKPEGFVEQYFYADRDPEGNERYQRKVFRDPKDSWSMIDMLMHAKNGDPNALSAWNALGERQIEQIKARAAARAANRDPSKTGGTGKEREMAEGFSKMGLDRSVMEVEDIKKVESVLKALGAAPKKRSEGDVLLARGLTQEEKESLDPTIAFNKVRAEMVEKYKPEVVPGVVEPGEKLQDDTPALFRDAYKQTVREDITRAKKTSPKGMPTIPPPKIAEKKGNIANMMRARGFDKDSIDALAALANQSGADKAGKIEIVREILEASGLSPEQLLIVYQKVAPKLTGEVAKAGPTKTAAPTKAPTPVPTQTPEKMGPPIKRVADLEKRMQTLEEISGYLAGFFNRPPQSIPYPEQRK